MVKISAIVIGLDLNGLGVTRWLHKEGVPVFAVDKDFNKDSAKTWSAKKITIRDVEGEDLIEDLIKLRARFDDNPVLFLTMERSVRTVSEYRDKLKDLYRFTLPDHDVLMALMDKNGVLEYAEKSGVRYPRTLNVNEKSDIDNAKNFHFPCIFKPATQNIEYGNKFKKAYKVNSHEDIIEIYDQVKSIQKEMIIQEWIEGGDSDIYFLLEYINKDGHVVADFPGRKIRSWPPNVGGTASCTAAYEALDEMRIATDKYFKVANFIGMGGMEFKRDKNSGELLMIEPTVARTDLQHEVAMLHGQNLVYAQYCSEIGEKFDATYQKKANIIWRVDPITRYSKSIQSNSEQEELEKKYPTIDALARFNDPLPFIYYFSGKVCEKLIHVAKKIIGK